MESSRKQGYSREGRGLTSSLISAASKVFSKIPIGGIVNTAIDALPVEVHLPGGYQYCGPGTRLKERLARSDPGINELDRACKRHDIAYSKFFDTANRSKADRELGEKAWGIFKSSDSTFGERAAALAVSAAMKAKSSIGGGRRRRNRNSRKCKRGGKIHRRRYRNHKKKNYSHPSVWTMVKSGRGLYLKPYQRVY